MIRPGPLRFHLRDRPDLDYAGLALASGVVTRPRRGERADDGRVRVADPCCSAAGAGRAVISTYEVEGSAIVRPSDWLDCAEVLVPFAELEVEAVGTTENGASGQVTLSSDAGLLVGWRAAEAVCCRGLIERADRISAGDSAELCGSHLLVCTTAAQKPTDLGPFRLYLTSDV